MTRIREEEEQQYQSLVAVTLIFAVNYLFIYYPSSKQISELNHVFLQTEPNRTHSEPNPSVFKNQTETEPNF